VKKYAKINKDARRGFETTDNETAQITAMMDNPNEPGSIMALIMCSQYHTLHVAIYTTTFKLSTIYRDRRHACMVSEYRCNKMMTNTGNNLYR